MSTHPMKPPSEPLTPFDGLKTLCHIPYWRPMDDVAMPTIPPPVLVTLDPINRCNLSCPWCNGKAALQHAASRWAFDDAAINEIPPMLHAWGVRAVCIAGGGEPCLHSGLSLLIQNLVASHIEVGVVTNGTLMDRHLSALGLCRWVGVSVDAGCDATYRAAKGAPMDRVLTNMTALRAAHPGLEITYKFLVHPKNFLEIPQAVAIADQLRCTYFHARPAGVTWHDVLEAQQRGEPAPKTLFTPEEVRASVHLLNAVIAASPWKNGLRIANTPGKFSEGTWSITHPFSHCRAVGMTCAIQANGTVSLCCDRRGDPRVELCTWDRADDVRAAWNSPGHHAILRSIDLDECPRCTYAPHNALYEAFVLHDTACQDFI